MPRCLFAACTVACGPKFRKALRQTAYKSQQMLFLARFLEHKVRSVEYNSGNEANFIGSKRFVVQTRRLGWNTIG